MLYNIQEILFDIYANRTIDKAPRTSQIIDSTRFRGIYQYSRKRWNRGAETKELHHRWSRNNVCILPRFAFSGQHGRKGREKKIDVAVEKLKVFSRKETRSGRESGKERKPRQRYLSRTDGWSIGRTGQTDRQAGRRTNERKESASWCREAGRLHDDGLATSHRAQEDLYPRSWHGAARHDSARSAQVRLGPRPRSPPNT